MGGVPKVHFQMEFPRPTVAGQSGLLRRQVAGALNGGQILGKNDAALQFMPARVFAPGKIHRAAGAPEAPPMPGRRLARGLETGRCPRHRPGGKRADKLKGAGIRERRQEEFVPGGLREPSVCPTGGGVIGSGVEPAVELAGVRAGGPAPRFMRLRFRPVRGDGAARP